MSATTESGFRGGGWMMKRSLQEDGDRDLGQFLESHQKYLGRTLLHESRLPSAS